MPCFYLPTPKSALMSNISGGCFISLHGLVCAPYYSICLGLGCFISKDSNKFHMWGFKFDSPKTAKATEHHGTPHLVCNKATSVMCWATGQTFPPNALIQPLAECEKMVLWLCLGSIVLVRLTHHHVHRVICACFLSQEFDPHFKKKRFPLSNSKKTVDPQFLNHLQRGRTPQSTWGWTSEH